MKNAQKNKHGLKRYIEADIARKIRQDAGYGCVMCGVMFVDYEHIEPEFKDAREHDPEKMTLLCKPCHDDVTYKRKTKKKVWLAKADPFTKKHGLVKGIFDPETEFKEVKIGSLTSTGSSIFMKVFGKPIFWFSEPEDPDEPIGFNAIFSSSDGMIGYMEKNIFHGVVAKHDIDSHGFTIEIRKEKGKILLVMHIEGDATIYVERFSIDYLGYNITVNKKGATLRGGNIHGSFDISNVTIAMDRDRDSTCAFSIGHPPRNKIRDGISFVKKTIIASLLNIERTVFSSNGDVVGWVLDNIITSKDYECIAVIKRNDKGEIGVFNILDEFIGLLKKTTKGYSVIYNDTKYPSGEPIWISNNHIKARNTFLLKEYDLSHRIY
ncbi:hypothetical protein DET57_1392 [Klebsiella oxytoca]|uniref:HNH nuclease domain-containing protein n=1 Tax=Klebsiella oxytoca TaxID=571 RepID=A0A318F7J5_KLEOX|nr:HNH endonuclease signature motif containing protein [Klebsiella oxytoca]PXW33200.1 hypothetical protein DET57_1392 [Klebsiella oxytoca]